MVSASFFPYARLNVLADKLYLVLGHFGVGKTSLLISFLWEIFNYMKSKNDYSLLEVERFLVRIPEGSVDLADVEPLERIMNRDPTDTVDMDYILLPESKIGWLAPSGLPGRGYRSLSWFMSAIKSCPQVIAYVIDLSLVERGHGIADDLIEFTADINADFFNYAISKVLRDIISGKYEIDEETRRIIQKYLKNTPKLIILNKIDTWLKHGLTDDDAIKVGKKFIEYLRDPQDELATILVNNVKEISHFNITYAKPVKEVPEDLREYRKNIVRLLTKFVDKFFPKKLQEIVRNIIKSD